jgi:hypothetical protein
MRIVRHRAHRADHRVLVGPAGIVPPGQPAHGGSSRRRFLPLALGLLVAGVALGAGAARISPTHALMTSTADQQQGLITAGTWGQPTIPPTPTPTPPSECAAFHFSASHIIVLTPGHTTYTAPHGYSGYLIFGTDGADIITGSNHGDCIVGGGGDDTIHGGNGSDVLIGGDGDDTIYGDNGADTIYGESGDDTLNGGNGPDHGVFGGPGDDTINGDNGPDTVDGGSGTDHCNGGRAPDKLTSCEFADGDPVIVVGP